MRAQNGITTTPHDFDGLQTRAIQDQSAVGFLTTNLLAIQTMMDEVMYTAYRLPDFIAINTAIAEGAATYGVVVTDRTGAGRPHIVARLRRS